MKAVVLVGGVGTRLRPLTLTTPKQMLPVAGRPMIERVLSHLADHGIDEAVLSLGYRPDAFLEAYPLGRCAGVSLQYAVEAEPLDTAGAVGFAARQARLSETFVVVNGDVLTGLHIGDLVRFHRERQAEATISLTPVDDPSRYGVVSTDDQGRVIAFIEKPLPGEAPTNLINAGTYVVEPGLIDQIPTGRPVSIERETFPALVARGTLYALATDAEWLDAGTPATYLQANFTYARRGDQWVNESATIAPSARVTGSVVSAGAVVASGAVVEGALVQCGARVGAGAVVRDSIVGAGAVVGGGAVVEALSVLGPGACVPPGATIRDARVTEVPE